MYCSACGNAHAPDGRYCTACGQELRQDSTAEVAICPRCTAMMGVADRFCPKCGFLIPVPEPHASESPPRRAPDAVASPSAPRRPDPQPGRHSPLLALLLGVVLPGAGQAYNGQPVKGFFLFFGSALALPYFLSLYDAYATAARIRLAGLSSGCAGFFWVFLQFWLAVNTALLTLLVLTVLGVLQ